MTKEDFKKHINIDKLAFMYLVQSLGVSDKEVLVDITKAAYTAAKNMLDNYTLDQIAEMALGMVQNKQLTPDIPFGFLGAKQSEGN